MELVDLEIKCKLCGEVFIWSIGEQEFYYDNNLSQPTKCAICPADLRRKLRWQLEERRAKEVQHGK